MITRDEETTISEEQAACLQPLRAPIAHALGYVTEAATCLDPNDLKVDLAAILVDLARPLLGGVYQALGGTLAELGAINDLDEHRGPVFARLRAKRAI
jgi:hypothetical protein